MATRCFDGLYFHGEGCELKMNENRDRTALTPHETGTLIEQCGQGNHAAFERLYRHFSTALYRAIVASVGDEQRGKDILQETFLRIFENSRRYSEEGKAIAWMYRIAVNLCRSDIAKRQRTVRLLNRYRENRAIEHPVLSRKGDPYATLEGKDLRRHLLRILCRLPDGQRFVFSFKHFGGLSYAQIGEILDIPVGTVKSRMNACLKKLRKELKHIL
jgi:RNA polymerase sigma-70 factor (ECF subfamily)